MGHSKPARPLFFGTRSTLVGFCFSATGGLKLRYNKPALSFSQQADQLLDRGLLADRDTLVRRLKAVNYYRLSAYWHTFRDLSSSNDALLPGTDFDVIWRRYTFDRRLRLLVIDAIERIEVALRTQLTNIHTLKHGAFGYIDRSTLFNMSEKMHSEFLNKIRNEAGRSKEDFVQHYHKKYVPSNDLPLWMTCELMSFGCMLTLFRHSDKTIKFEVASEYGISGKVLESWLLTLNFVRNICAHHGRLWNRGFDQKAPAIPRVNKNPEWHIPVIIKGDRMFGVLTVLYYLLKQVAPQSNWKGRFESLLDEYNDVPMDFMGFPEDWRSSPLWQ